MTENVRAALVLVARGEAALGIVYETDAAVEPGVEDRRPLPRRLASADRLSGRADREGEAGSGRVFQAAALGDAQVFWRSTGSRICRRRTVRFHASHLSSAKAGTVRVS